MEYRIEEGDPLPEIFWGFRGVAAPLTIAIFA